MGLDWMVSGWGAHKKKEKMTGETPEVRSDKRKREKEREKMSRVNYYQYAFNSKKKKLNILAEILKISKSGCRGSIYYNRPPSL